MQRLTQNTRLRKSRTVLEVKIPQSMLSDGGAESEGRLGVRVHFVISQGTELLLLMFWSQVSALCLAAVTLITWSHASGRRARQHNRFKRAQPPAGRLRHTRGEQSRTEI